MIRTETTSPDVATEWTEEQILELLRSEKGREVLVTVILELLEHDERVKEAVAGIAQPVAVKVSRDYQGGQPVMGGRG